MGGDVSPVLTFAVGGVPQGARRHRMALRGSRPVAYHADEHLMAEHEIATMARSLWRGAPLDGPVRLVVTTYHRRPQSLAKTRRWWGDEVRPYVGKPDADNVAKLVMDALTRAGVWVDDTRVHELVVRRWWVAVSAEGVQGLPGTRVDVYTVPE